MSRKLRNKPLTPIKYTRVRHATLVRAEQANQVKPDNVPSPVPVGRLALNARPYAAGWLLRRPRHVPTCGNVPVKARVS